MPVLLISQDITKNHNILNKVTNGERYCHTIAPSNLQHLGHQSALSISLDRSTFRLPHTEVPCLVQDRILNSALSDGTGRASVEGEARASSQSRLVDAADRSAVHVPREGVERVEQRAERRVRQARDQRDLDLGELAREAQRAFGGLFGRVGAVGEGRRVDRDLGDGLGEVEDVGLDWVDVIWDGVLISWVALVEVVREALVAALPVEVLLIVAIDGHEALQDLLVEDTLGVLLRLVGHEAVDEGEGRLGDLDTGEGKVYEIICQRHTGSQQVALLTEVTQDLQVVVGCSSVGLTVVQAVELVLDELLIGAILVQVRLQRRAVGLVVVVRATDADVGTAIDGPSEEVAVDERTVEGEETTKILGHSETGLGGIDELLDGGVSVVRKVVVICQGIQTGTLATSITWTWRHKLVLALIADILRLCVERRTLAGVNLGRPLDVESLGLQRLGESVHSHRREGMDVGGQEGRRDGSSGEGLHLRGGIEGWRVVKV
ncbi:hypothetical protein KC317_g70 [Hortaea werneckii]|nr:hypothetical protein KC317_g70 [Hortaea werneckii]KAI7628706.1 hypothetical protein KC346_g74 [Hortaea werneckii]